MLSMMLGAKGKINFSEEDEEKEELRIRAQRKRDNIRDGILCDHQEKEQMIGELVKLRAANTRMMELLGLDQSEEKEVNKTSNKTTELSLDKKRKLEEDRLDSLLEGLKKRGEKF